jgi:hypothetical protein
MVAVPSVTPVASPELPAVLLMLAMLLFDEAQDAVAVRKRVVPSL